MEDFTKLDDVTLSYDYSNGAIRILSNDSRLEGKSFQLTVTSNSDSYKSLLTLLENEGLVDMSKVNIPRTAKISSITELAVAGQDPRDFIKLGIGLADKSVELNLATSPHVLVMGPTGSGKSVVLRNFLAHGLAHDEIQIYGIDLKRVEFSAHKYRPQDKWAYSKEDAFALLRQLADVLRGRYDMMQKAGVNSYKQLPDTPAIYLVIDEAFQMLVPEANYPNAYQVEINWLINSFAKLGRAAGIHCIFGTQRASIDVIGGELKANLSTRILMGNLPAKVAIDELGFRPEFGGALLTTRGRGIVTVYGVQTLFQGFFLPIDLLK